MASDHLRLGNGFARLASSSPAWPGATTGDPAVVLAAQAPSQLPLVLATGVVGDRFCRYRLVLGTDPLAIAAIAWTAIAAMASTATPWSPPSRRLALSVVLCGIATDIFGILWASTI